MNRFTLAAIVASFFLPTCTVKAQVPQILNYQGRVSVNGTNFDGTGQFMFALVDGTGSSTYWSNGNSVVSLPVVAGLYSVLLGDTALANMAAIPPTVFTNGNVRLRVWFDGGVGLQQLTPDRRLGAVGYAFMAGNVSDGAITSSKLATGAVTTVAIANGAVGTSQLANNAVTSANIAPGAVTSVDIASNTITVANIAPGAGLVPPSTIVLSQTAANDALTTAGFAPLVTLTDIPAAGAGSNWTQATASAPWSIRYRQAAITFGGKMWVLGGKANGNTNYNDVWSSLDGTNWTRVTAAAPWSPRYSHTAVSFNGKMWVLGGWNTTTLNDVWSSADGTNWTQVTAAAPWIARYVHGTVVFNGKMYVIGGSSCCTGWLHDVWSSSDGTNWTQLTAAAPWSPRYSLGAVTANGQMWVLGGFDGNSRNDVWSSSDGITWTQVPAAGQWSGRSDHATATTNGKMWVLGGDSGTNYLNDVWSSPDGTNWTRATAAAPWSIRTASSAVSYNGQIIVLGGYNGMVGVMNNVWSSTVSSSTSTSSVMLGQFYLFQKQ